MGKRTTEHHRLPESLCPKFNILINDIRNIILKSEKEHRAYHVVFGDLPPEEAIKKLILEWLPPPSVFDVKNIKNKQLRALYLRFWREKIKENVIKLNHKCIECSHNLVKVGKIGGIFEFNCEICGQDRCYSCILCKKPARISVDESKKIFICSKCLINFVEKSTRLPEKYRTYTIKLRKWYRTQFLS